MKTLYRVLMFTFLSVMLSACDSEDDNEQSQNSSIVGTWEFTSGDLEAQWGSYGQDVSYLIFKDDNIVELLYEAELGFRNRRIGIYSADNEQLRMDFDGVVVLTIVNVEDNRMTIREINDSAIFERVSQQSPTENWVQSLNIINETNAPINSVVDIAFSYDENRLLFPDFDPGGTNNQIALINPDNMEVQDYISRGSEEVFALDIQNTEPTEGLRLEASGSNFSGWTQGDMSMPTFAYTFNSSFEIAALASVDADKTWISFLNDDGTQLALFNSTTNTNIAFIELENNVWGITWNNGYLYVSLGGNVHKCLIQPTFNSFSVIETYKLDGFTVFGVTNDGVNLWVNAVDNNSQDIKIIKTDLTL